MEKRTVALLATVLVLCVCAAWASVAGDGKAKVSVGAAERAKTSAEKGDAVAQFRYAEMLRDGRSVLRTFLTADAGCAVNARCVA